MYLSKMITIASQLRRSQEQLLSWLNLLNCFCNDKKNQGSYLYICVTNGEKEFRTNSLQTVLETEGLVNLLLEVSIRSNTLEQLKYQLEQIIGMQKPIGTSQNFGPNFLFFFRFQILTILLHSIPLYILNNFMKEKITLRTVSRQWFIVPQVTNLHMFFRIK